MRQDPSAKSSGRQPGELVHLVDDQADVTSALAWLLESVHVDSRSHHSARAFLDSYHGDDGVACLVTDLRMPEMSGLELIEELRRRGFQIPVIVLTAHGDIPTAVSSMRLGALDFMQKPFNGEELLSRINKALRHSREQHLRTTEQRRIESELAHLSPREREVFHHLLDGETSKEMAKDMHISHKTVDVHRATLMRKLGVRSASELIKKFRTLRRSTAEPTR